MTSKRNAKISTSSQGGKVVPCVRCKGDIQPYAGRAVSLIGAATTPTMKASVQTAQHARRPCTRRHS